MGRGRSRRSKPRKQGSKQDVICLPPPQEPPIAQKLEIDAHKSAIPLSGDRLNDGSAGLILSDPAQTTQKPLPMNRQERRRAKRRDAKAKKRRGKLMAGTSAPDVLTTMPDNEGQKHWQSAPLQVPSKDSAADQLGAGTAQQTPKYPAAASAPPLMPSPEDYLASASAQNGAAPEKDNAALTAPNAKVPKQDTGTDSHSDQGASKSQKQKTPTSSPARKVDATAPLPRNRTLADPNEKLIGKLKRWMRSLILKKKASPPAAKGRIDLEALIVLRTDLASAQARLDKMIEQAGKR